MCNFATGLRQGFSNRDSMGGKPFKTDAPVPGDACDLSRGCADMLQAVHSRTIPLYPLAPIR